MIGPIEFISAFFLDLAIGDPRWLPHPVRLIGRAITFLENAIRTRISRHQERAGGILLVLLVVPSSAFLAFLVNRALLTVPAHPVLALASTAVLVYLVATTLALRGLVSASMLVINAVHRGDLDTARAKLSMIVGRDTGNLDREGMLRAVIETLAENLSDGVIAPVFYLAIGGLPLGIAYKAINTLDSMVGYKNEKYFFFGWAAARLDDAANYLPARISGLLIVAASFFWFLVHSPGRAFSAARNSFSVMRRDGRNHTSPNSGISEAAMAGCLGVRLGGPSTYGGVLVEKPFIGERLTDDYLSASRQAVRVVLLSGGIAACTAAVVLWMRVTS